MSGYLKDKFQDVEVPGHLDANREGELKVETP